MLMSCDIPIPRQVLVHGFIYHRGEKMSKTLGNIVDPFALVDSYGRDPIRYFLLREIGFGYDGNYSEEALIKRYNADLANDLGNLFSRVLSMLKKYREGVVPRVAGSEDQLRLKIPETVDIYIQNMDRYALHLAISAVWELISHANRYVDEQAPWALAKDPDKAEQLDRVLLNLIETLRTVAIMVHPIMPEKSQIMLERLNCAVEGGPDAAPQLENLIKGADMYAGTHIQPGEALFPRLEVKK
jgi:methionyl-tRNA synthetase